MPDAAAILACCDTLDELVTALGKVAERIDHERKHELVRLRRQLSDQLALLHDKIVASKLPITAGAAGEEFRARFSVMRSVVARHQAEYPAVLLDEADDEYRRSGAKVSSSIRETVAWVRATVRAGF